MSSAARLISATGTYLPSIWQKELPNCNFAMSLRRGSSDQPDTLWTWGASIVAPHAGQLRRAPSLTRPHQGHVCVDITKKSRVSSPESRVLNPQSQAQAQSSKLKVMSGL